MPGFADPQRRVALLLAWRLGAEAYLLLLAAGGGLELQALAAFRPGWRFTGVDPSADMLAAAATRIAPHAPRCLTAVSTAPRRAGSTAPPAC